MEPAIRIRIGTLTARIDKVHNRVFQTINYRVFRIKHRLYREANFANIRFAASKLVHWLHALTKQQVAGCSKTHCGKNVQSPVSQILKQTFMNRRLVDIGASRKA